MTTVLPQTKHSVVLRPDVPADELITHLKTMARAVWNGSTQLKTSGIAMDDGVQMLVIAGWRYASSGNYTKYVMRCEAEGLPPLPYHKIMFRKLTFEGKTMAVRQRPYVMSVPVSERNRIAQHYSEPTVEREVLTLKGTSLDGLDLERLSDLAQEEIEEIKTPENVEEMLESYEAVLLPLVSEGADAPETEEQQRKWWLKAFSVGEIPEPSDNLLEAVWKLDVPQARLFVMGVLWEWPSETIAGVLQTNTLNVKRAINDCKSALKEQLDRPSSTEQVVEVMNPTLLFSDTRIIQTSLWHEPIGVSHILHQLSQAWEDATTINRQSASELASGVDSRTVEELPLSGEGDATDPTLTIFGKVGDSVLTV